MNNNQAKRHILLAAIVRATMKWGGQPINRTWCPNQRYTPELQYLIDHKLVVLKRKVQSSMTSYSYALAYPQTAAEYLERFKCPLCKSELSGWYDMTGNSHSKTCQLSFNQ